MIAGAAVTIVMMWLVVRGGPAARPVTTASASAAPPTKISEADAQSVVGVYKVDSFIENEAGCDAATQPVERAPAYVAVETYRIMNDPMVMISDCASPEACAATRQAMKAGMGSSDAILNRYLSEQRSPTWFGGFYAMGGFGDPDRKVCHGRYYEDLSLTVTDAGLLRFEIRTRLLSERPFDRGGCSVSSDAIRAEAAPLPCASLRVLIAQRVR